MRLSPEDAVLGVRKLLCHARKIALGSAAAPAAIEKSVGVCGSPNKGQWGGGRLDHCLGKSRVGRKRSVALGRCGSPGPRIRALLARPILNPTLWH